MSNNKHWLPFIARTASAVNAKSFVATSDASENEIRCYSFKHPIYRFQQQKKKKRCNNQTKKKVGTDITEHILVCSPLW